VLALGATAAAGALAGCAVYGRQPEPAPAPARPTGAAEPGSGDDSSGSDGSGSGSDGDGDGDGGSGPALARTGDVPAGGGLILSDAQVVLTQPAAGEFRGFSAVCTHQGCAVTSVSDGTINCPCHGSRFSIEDGSVVQAAAGLSPDQQSPLPEVAISVDGDTVALA
jgi:Rieske Fe-S protein